MNLRIGVTGSHGFIGTHLVPALFSSKFAEIKEFSARLEDHDAVRDFVLQNDVIVHLAGVNRAEPEEIVAKNILGCHQLLQFAAEGKWIVFASTCQKDTPYSWSKQTCEQMLQASVKAKRIVASVLRLPNIYGPGCRPFYNSVIATFSHLISQGKGLKDLPIHGDGKDIRHYLYVAELVRQMVTLIQTQRPSGYSCQEISGEPFSTREIAEILTDPEKLVHHPYLEQTLATYGSL